MDTRTDKELRAVVDAGSAAARELSRRTNERAEAVGERVKRTQRADPTAAFRADELIFAAYERCACGAGMAYPIGCGVHDDWHCSAILRGTASREMAHSAPLPFSLYEVKSESQPSANGATTRDEPKGGE